jgi:thiamine biosynthesis lipoprotein ApbE
MPVGKVVSVTVIADTAKEADALSTAVFILGPEEGEDLLEDIDGAGGIIAYLDDEGEIEFELTETAKQLFKKEVAAATTEDYAKTTELSYLK